MPGAEVLSAALECWRTAACPGSRWSPSLGERE